MLDEDEYFGRPFDMFSIDETISVIEDDPIGKRDPYIYVSKL